MKRVKPSERLRGIPCSMVAVACALGVETPPGGMVLSDGQYGSLNNMNTYVRRYLPVKRQTKYRRGERPKLKELHLDGKAIVCVLGHFLYLDHETYWSFFRNSDDPVVCVWELKEV